MRRSSILTALAVPCALIVGLAFAACSGNGGKQASQAPAASAQPSAQTTAEQPLAAESNPPGDIPDAQRFVTYTSDRLYSIAVPEGWARTVKDNTAIFTDKFDGERLSSISAAHAPVLSPMTVGSLHVTGRAVDNFLAAPVTLPAGSAVKVTFTLNSDPDEVTGKSVRLQNEAYVFYKNGHQVVVTLWAPLGSDNVDQWRHIEQSFKWL